MSVEFDLTKAIEWIKKNNFKKIALQFKDEQLEKSPFICQEIQNMTCASVCILGDTLYGSCCVDNVAAKHFDADAIIHFGFACLTKCTCMPTFLVYGQKDINLQYCYKIFNNNFLQENKNRAVAIFSDPVFDHQLDDFIELIVNSRLKIHRGIIILPFNHWDGYESSADEGQPSVFGRSFNIPNKMLDECDFFYIGEQKSLATCFTVRFSESFVFWYNPSENGEDNAINTRTLLMKRFGYIRRAMDEIRIFGIVVGTLSLREDQILLSKLRRIISSAGKKSYTFVVGKLTPYKLANFLEIEMFVLLACPLNSLIDNKEFYQPIITPHELQIALDPNIKSNASINLDYYEVQHSIVNLPENEDVSLNHDSSKEILVRSTNNAVDVYSAADYLSKRSWKGLEIPKEAEAPSVIKDGKAGLAWHYEHEFDNF